MALPFPVWVRRVVLSYLCFFLTQETALWFLMNHILHNRIKSDAWRGIASLGLGPGVLGLAIAYYFWPIAIVVFEFRASIYSGLNLCRSYDHRVRRLARLTYLSLRYGRTRRTDIYRDLDDSKREIRLIVIAPGAGHEEISCEVAYTHLGPKDNTLPYEALSYTWGNMYSLRCIKMNGSPLAITNNLGAALRRLRRPKESRAIWVDALCIDQENGEERGKQVQMMREIYENACEVIVWLGEESPSTNCAMEFLDLGSRQEDPRDWFLRSVVDRGLTYQAQWKAIILLFRKPYWTRVWIIQEIGYASRLAIMCGSKVVSWEVIVSCQSAWVEVRDRPISQSLRGKLPTMRGVSNLEQCALFLGFGTNKADKDSLILALHTTREAISMKAKPKNLIELLAMHRLALATDPRDKIYAVASLAADCRSPPLPVNYALSPWSVYLQTLKFLLETWGNLDFLVLSGTNQDRLYLWKPPSWVPDFYWVSTSKYVSQNSQSLYSSGFASFKASGDRRASPQTKFSTSYERFGGKFLHVRCPTLQIEAFKIDKIRRVYSLNHARATRTPQNFFSQLRAKMREETLERGDSWVPVGPDQNLVEHIQALNDKIMLEDMAEGVTEEERTEAFLRTLTNNLTAEGTKAPPEWSSMFTVLINGPAFVPADVTTNSTSSNENVNERAWAYVEPYVKAYRRISLGSHRIFVTEKGRLGTCSPYVGPKKNGIYIVPGCQMPIIIVPTRKPDSEDPFSAEAYGAVYLHGCMHGEAMADLDTGVSTLQTFNLH
ncbi:HET-domain-containing protein [Stipitochalara longipes BDJ]|nr:HET-domain-containing protein [Stipitochalara longipes BDJ]